MAIKDGSKKGIASLALLEVGLLELGFVVVVIAIILGVLNYFNIVSLSQLYPDKLGWLPHQAFKETAQQPQSIVKKATFACPVEKELCNTGEEIYDERQFLGIGYNLSVPSKIYAVIPGTAVLGGAEDKDKGILSHAKAVIGGTGAYQGYVATYDYFGLPATSSAQINISRGEHLGDVYGGSFPEESPFNGINLLIKVTTNTGQDVQISQFE